MIEDGFLQRRLEDGRRHGPFRDCPIFVCLEVLEESVPLLREKGLTGKQGVVLYHVAELAGAHLHRRFQSGNSPLAFLRVADNRGPVLLLECEVGKDVGKSLEVCDGKVAGPVWVAVLAVLSAGGAKRVLREEKLNVGVFHDVVRPPLRLDPAEIIHFEMFSFGTELIGLHLFSEEVRNAFHARLEDAWTSSAVTDEVDGQQVLVVLSQESLQPRHLAGASTKDSFTSGLQSLAYLDEGVLYGAAHILRLAERRNPPEAFYADVMNAQAVPCRTNDKGVRVSPMTAYFAESAARSTTPPYARVL